jgi:hypothetical protein
VKSYLAVAVLALISVGMAHADPRLDEKVYAPYVERGLLEFEARSAGLLDAAGGAQSASVFELEYGIDNHLNLALLGIESREPHGPARWSGAGVEAVYDLGQIGKTGVDAGLYLEYGNGLNGRPDKLEGKILLAKRVGRFEGLLNLIVERPLNAPNHGNFASYGYAASATWSVAGSVRIGVEALGDLGSDRGFLGRQGAYLGPQLKAELRPFGGGDADLDDDGDEPARRASHPIEIDIDAGWLAAVGPGRSEATSQVRIGVEVERKF